MVRGAAGNADKSRARVVPEPCSQAQPTEIMAQVERPKRMLMKEAKKRKGESDQACKSLVRAL